MKLTDYRGTYEYFSGKLSEISRSLCFMGFGVVWILIGGIDNLKPDKIPFTLKIVLGGLVLALIMDVLHYIYQTTAWYSYFRYLEKRDGTDLDVKYTAPIWITRIAWFLFWLKIGIMFASYVALLVYISRIII